jgi:hypothetical protein
MKYLSTVVLIFSASILFFASCEDCTEIYKTTGMNVRPLNDSLEVNVAVDTNATVSYENLYFYVVFDYDYEHFCEPGLRTETRFSSTIESFIITSNHEYNSNFQAGESLNSIIEISHSELTGFDNHELFPLIEYLETDGNCHRRFRLYLTEPPDTTRLHRFTIDYAEENGQSYQFTTHPFYITP